MIIIGTAPVIKRGWEFCVICPRREIKKGIFFFGEDCFGDIVQGDFSFYRT